MRIKPGGEPFFHIGNQLGCLLVHGFPGAPLEMAWLGDALRQKGFTVLGIRLFGHATEPHDLLRVHASDWLAGLEDGYHLLRGHCTKIVLIGFSLGGILSATIASALELDGLVLMAMPMDLPLLAHRLRPFLPLLRHVWPYRTPPQGSDWWDKEAEAQNLHYTVQPIQAVGQFFDLIQRLPTCLAQVRVPTLLLYSKNDGSVPIEHGSRALDALATEAKELVWIDGSGHNLARDAQRHQVFQLVGDFVHKVGMPV